MKFIRNTVAVSTLAAFMLTSGLAFAQHMTITIRAINSIMSTTRSGERALAFSEGTGTMVSGLITGTITSMLRREVMNGARLTVTMSLPQLRPG